MDCDMSTSAIQHFQTEYTKFDVKTVCPNKCRRHVTKVHTLFKASK